MARMAASTSPTPPEAIMTIGWSKGIAAQVSLPSMSVLLMGGAAPAGQDCFEQVRRDESKGLGWHRLARLRERLVGDRVECPALRFRVRHPGGVLIGRDG